MLMKKLLPLALMFTVFGCNGLEIEQKPVIKVVPADICSEQTAFESQATTIFTECKDYEFINQYVVVDAMSMADFSQFVAQYQLGEEFDTTLEQELLRHFDAMISPFDPKTKVSRDGDVMLFETKSQLALFQRNADHWLLTKAVLPAE